MAHLSRKERERLRHRRQMLLAAEELFARQGFHATTMQEVADRAEFSVGTLYNTFDNKLDLYYQLVQSRVEEYFQTVSERIEAADAALEKVRAVISTKLKFFADHQQFFRIFTHIVASARPRPPHAFPPACRGLYRAYQEKLSDVFTAGIEAGTFVESNPLLMALALEGMTNVMIARWIHGDGQGQELFRAEPIERLFLHGVLSESQATEVEAEGTEKTRE